MTVQPHDRIAVWFSCGAASAVALKLALDLYGHDRVRAINQPIAEEDEDNRRFLADVARWLNHPVEIALHPKHPEASADAIWRKRRFMSSPYGAPCTTVLKKQNRQEWEKANPVEWHVLGFTAEEEDRHESFVLTERENVLPLLIDGGYTKGECLQIIERAGIELPLMYRLGFPNANCKGCIKSKSAAYWNHTRKHFPDVFGARAALSREIGCRLVEVGGERIFLDELSPDVGGSIRQVKMPDCGLFCEERLPFKRRSAA